MVKGRVSFANGTKGGRTLKKKERRPGAFGQNCPAFFLFPRAGKQRSGEGSPAAARPAALGADVASGLGENGERGERTRSPAAARPAAACSGPATVAGDIRRRRCLAGGPGP